MRRFKALAAALLPVLAVAVALRFVGGDTADEPEIHGKYLVSNVVDGDTIDVEIDGETVRVRLIGVDTPESVHPDESRNTEEGEIASAWTKQLLFGQYVYLEYDVQPEDTYGRRLAYVYLDDGETMVNRLLLENGLAQVMTVQPNSKYASEFYELQQKARAQGMGFWGE